MERISGIIPAEELVAAGIPLECVPDVNLIGSLLTEPGSKPLGSSVLVSAFNATSGNIDTLRNIAEEAYMGASRSTEHERFEDELARAAERYTTFVSKEGMEFDE